jgi:hypothetical protein
MNEEKETRFTIRDEGETPDSFYMADAENLRIEKLSTRITLVAVLIPCLLVIVLAVAYLDIKNRVTCARRSWRNSWPAIPNPCKPLPPPCRSN